MKSAAWVVGVVLLVGLSWGGWLDDYSDGYTEQSLTQAAATFALARGLNGTISVLQSTEFSFNLLGGVSVAVGEVLDPLNDLIERFSWIAMAAMASLGIQKLLLTIASSAGFQGLVTLTGAGVIGAKLAGCQGLLPLVLRWFVLALFLRFAVGLTVALNHWTETAFLEQSRQQATLQLQRSKALFEQYQDQQLDAARDRGDGWWDGVKSTWEQLFGGRRFAELEQQVEQSARSVVDLIVVFIAQTLLFPLLFLWLFYRLWRYVWRWPASPTAVREPGG